MRVAIIIPGLALGVCLTTAPVEAQRCRSTSCFNQTQIRGWEVVDTRTLIVYVGEEQCAFRVELTGGACEIRTRPANIAFRSTLDKEFRSQGLLDTAANTRSRSRSSRVCSNDTHLGLDASLRQPGGAAGDASNLPCRVRRVSSLSDDELIEIYVSKQGGAPPPPIAPGRIEVKEDEEAEGASEDAAASEDER